MKYLSLQKGHVTVNEAREFVRDLKFNDVFVEKCVLDSLESLMISSVTDCNNMNNRNSV